MRAPDNWFVIIPSYGLVPDGMNQWLQEVLFK